MSGFDAAGTQTVPQGLCLDDIKRTIWLTRLDLRELYAEDRPGFERWLLLNGSREYRSLTEADGVVMSQEFLSEPAAEALPGVQPVLTRAMKLAWDARSDLHQHFDLGTASGQQGFAWWLLVSGARESAWLEKIALAACRTLMSELAPEAISGVQPPLTAFMVFVRAMRRDLQEYFDLRTAKGQQSFVCWYFTHGPAELGLARYFTDAQKRLLNEPYGQTTGDVPISRLMWWVWLRRDDVQQAFPLDSRSGRTGFVNWFFAHGIAEMGLTDLGDLVPDTTVAPERPAEPARICTSAVRGRHGELPFGVNLVGHARGQFGIGEDVRMAALAMQMAGIPFSIYNVDPSPGVCQADDSVASLINDTLPYRINLLCTTGIEAARLAAVEGTRLFDGRRTIGYWPWELSSWPEEWRHAYNLVDEVWASSRHTYEAYAKSSPKPVRHMPMAVTTGGSAGMTRLDFGLPEHRFLFIFAFDFLSGMRRKNPQACVQAFRYAFPLGDEPVGLVIKAMRPAPDNPAWQALVTEAGADPRITIINGTLTRNAVLDLCRVCDCFLSLHRSEGFGRGIAEAMMMGKPAIVTGYSGNLDFTTPGTAALVDHTLCPVAVGDYPFGEGQVWAEPDIAHAAWWMQRLVKDQWLRERLSQQGRLLTEGTYAPDVVGAGYAALLKPA
ncbi:glycosyltransferase family 4 protein [Niveispirillum cyanobacteriorum]|uniref:Group 1 glycosyl transferase n=1 Tax=Niveispirillum cyanobacteriorum TaxID=1612173 RepID=A0A2K9NLL3_9PROT|nr:glycosyltransferase [Niveispirillum cyanobacteriorum]AUN33968.1 group 1 glycosyl transferase [Niveispirillum cyanobacteriorum]GGE89384.1 hypothetical protein GCM10011317_52970 [Niveispirillum cyanobacteriorum]